MDLIIFFNYGNEILMCLFEIFRNKKKIIFMFEIRFL